MSRGSHQWLQRIYLTHGAWPLAAAGAGVAAESALLATARQAVPAEEGHVQTILCSSTVVSAYFHVYVDLSTCVLGRECKAAVNRIEQ